MLALVARSADFITTPSLCRRGPREFSHLQEQDFFFILWLGFWFFSFPSLQVSPLFPTPWRISKLFKKFAPSSGVLYEHGSVGQLINPRLPPSSQKYCFFPHLGAVRTGSSGLTTPTWAGARAALHSAARAPL